MSAPPVSRTNARLLVRMPLTVFVGKRSCPVQSEQIWTGGLLVRCDLPVPPRQLVKLQIETPPEGERVSLNAMVDSVRPAAPGVAPALTLSLYGNGGAPLDRWNALLNEIRARFPDAASHPVVTAQVAPSTPDAVHRHHVRFFAAFEVRVATVDELMTLVTGDISRGGLFLRTRRAVATGDLLQLDLVHPISGDVFPLRGVVRRRVSDGEASGLGVELVDLDAERQKALWEFVSSGLPDVEIDLVEE